MKKIKYILLIVGMILIQKLSAYKNTFSVNYSNTSMANISIGIYPFLKNDSVSDYKINGVFVEPSLGLSGANIFIGYGTIFSGAHLQFLGYEAGLILGHKYLFDYGLSKNSGYFGVGIKIDAGLIPIKIGYLIDDRKNAIFNFEIGIGF